MSETQTSQPAPEYVPQNVLAAEENEDATQPLQQPQDAPQQAADGADDKPPADEAEEQRRAERRREAGRIGYLTKQRYAEKARADALEAELRAMRSQHGGQPATTPEEIEQLIDQRAAERLALQQHNARVAEWDKGGKESFGAEKFDAACTTVADMASPQQRAMLLQVALDTEGGQRAIVEMADNPEEAERILAMPPHRMALALAKLGAAPATPARPVSNAPPPIRPPTTGRARGEPDPERGDYGSYERWSAKVQWRR